MVRLDDDQLNISPEVAASLGYAPARASRQPAVAPALAAPRRPGPGAGDIVGWIIGVAGVGIGYRWARRSDQRLASVEEAIVKIAQRDPEAAARAQERASADLGTAALSGAALAAAISDSRSARS